MGNSVMFNERRPLGKDEMELNPDGTVSVGSKLKSYEAFAGLAQYRKRTTSRTPRAAAARKARAKRRRLRKRRKR